MRLVPKFVLLPLLSPSGIRPPSEHRAEDETHCFPACWSHSNILLLSAELLLSAISCSPPALLLWPRPQTEPSFLRAISSTGGPGNAARSSSKTPATVLATKPCWFPPLLHSIVPAPLHLILGVQTPKSKRLLPASAQDLPTTNEGTGGHPGHSHLCRAEEAANGPSTQGQKRKPQTANSPQMLWKGEAAVGPCKLSRGSWEVRCAPGICKPSRRHPNAAGER